jgi:DUF4097 and DUF4098 domain-containing protein YvlB
MREDTFQLPTDPRLAVSLAAGRVDIETQPGSEAFVRLSPITDDSDTRKLIEQAHVELHGNELVVKVKDKHFRFGNHPEVHAEIRVPERTGTQLHTASADVRVEGTLGDVKTHSASGDVELARVEGRLELHSASGDVTVGFIRGDVKAHSASGQLELRQTDAGIEIRSASGDVSVGDAGAGPIRVHSASGDVRIGVREGRRVAVDVRTVSGLAQSDIPLDGSEGDSGDGPLVEIKVNGVSGDVRIERSQTASVES